MLVFLTLGNAYPYSIAYRDYVANQNCCPCCDKSQEISLGDFDGHAATERQSYDFNPCGKPSNRYAGAFATESFLVPVNVALPQKSMIRAVVASLTSMPETIFITPPKPPPMAS